MSDRTERQDDRRYFALMVLAVLGAVSGIMALSAAFGLLGWPEAIVATALVSLISVASNALTWRT